MKDKVTPLETKSKFLYLDFELINKKTTFLFLLVSTFFCVSVNAQSGYIYVHKKALNEKSSIDFPFTVSGGPTAVAPFSLNDGDGQLRVKDLGSSQNGRLWAIHETTNTLYYRNTNSNVWVKTSIADANRVDGDKNGNAVYINTSGTVFSTDGTTTTQLSSAAAYSGTADIGSGWNGLPYVTRGGIIYQYSGAGITWNVVSDQSATYSSSAIDVDPTNPSICYVVVRNTASSTNSIIRVNAGVVTNIGAPSGMSNAASNIPRDVAVNDKAELFISAQATNWDVYKYTSSWSAAEVTSDASNLTGGVGGELWVTMNSGNQNFGQPTVPYYNIFTRATNGTNVYYIDDERVRTTAGNSILIPVLPGTYTITEALSTAGWDLQAIRIEDPTNNSTSNHVTGTATIDVAAGEIVNVVFQNGQLNPIAMTASCTANYLEDFGTGAVGTFGSLVPGQTSYHFLDNTVRAEDGYCKVVSTAFPDFNNWRATPFYDHTSGNGTGRMYAVNAGYDLGEFFRRRFTGVVPGLTYNVSAWVANLTPGAAIKPNIKFQIVDHITQAVIATYDTGNINTGTIQWNQYGFTFTATSSDIDLILSNNAIGGNGNDLAIDDISFSFTPPHTPTPTIGSVTQPTCSVANGNFTITNYSSANTYSITSATGTVVSGPTATGLVTVTAGSYTVTSTPNGCTSAPVNVTINAQPVTPAVPTVSPVTHPTCSVATGSFTITNYNATNTYTFVPAGPTIDASGVVTASTGSYTLTASANGCTSASVSVTVNAQPATPATPTIGSVTQPTCSVATGSFTITNYNATNTYTFVPAGPTIDASGVVTASTGSYTLTASANGCTSASVSVTVNAQPATPATPTIGSVTQPTCSVATGSFTITNYNATNTYTFVPAGPTIDASGVVTASTGSYTLTASANGCTSASVSVTVNAQPATPATPTIGSVTQPTCSVATGSFTITNYNATNTYTFVPAGPTIDASGVVTASTGSYTLTASANGCTSASVSVTVNAQPATPATPTIGSVTQPTCSVATGSFTITNYNATNTYTFVPAGPTIDASGVVTASTGSYTLTASANGCTSASVSVTVNAQPATPATPTIGSVTQPTCSVATGSFTITNYNATNTYTFVPAGPTIDASGVVTASTGSYTLTASANGCTSASVSVTVNAQPVTPAVPTVSPVTHPTCSVATGSFTITNYDATNTYTFVPAGPTIDASGVVTASTGSYTLTASANGCTSASVSVTVNAQPATPATPVISNITHPVCTVSASPNGSFVISNYSASTTYSFIPTTGTVVSGPTATGLVTVTAGSYTVTSTSNGCTSAPVVVVINPLECADIVTVKTDNQTSYVPGQPVTYIITVTNNGPTAATNVNVVDNAPTGTTFTSWSSSNGSGTGNINDTIATLAVGQTVTYTVNVDVPATLLGNLVNTVTVTTTTPDPVPGCTTCTDIDTPNTTLAENDINNTFMNIPVSGSVLTNDSDPQGHAQTVTASTTTTPEGTLVLNADGTYTFTPATDFTGTFVHTYTVCDSGTPQACDTATLTIEVMPNPNDPDATNDVVANDDTATTEEGQPVTINILSNDFDPNGDTLGTPTVVTPPTNGTFDPVTGVYTPNPGFVGVDTFVYQVCDDATPQACDTAVVTITVNPTNPVNTTDANDDAYNGDQYQPINGSVLDNDNDIEGNTQTVTSNTQPQNGTVVMNPDGTFVYTPTGEYSGPDQFTYTVCDNGTPQACDTATVYLTINPANTTNAENDINNTFMNIPVSGSVLTNDSDPQGHTQTVTASTTTTPEGTLVLNADGTYTFTPATDFTGTFVHTYTVCDSGTPQACDTATLTIEVMPNPNDPDATNDVVANDDTATTEEGQPVTINILSNDFDPNGDTLGTPTVVTPPTNGTFDPVTGVYTPNPGFVGVDTFVYQVCDDATPQACDTAVVTITVNPTNPVNTTDANDDAYNGDQYQPINGSVLDNDNDIEGNTQTVTSNTQPQNGTVVMNPDGTFVYTPTGEYSGPDQFTYTVCDNGTPQACDTATVYLTINPANTTNAENDINNTFMNIPVSGSVLTNDSDPQGHTQTVTASTTTTPEGTLVLNADGTYTFTPATDFTGTFVHTYTVCDSGTPQACDTATLTIEVMPNPNDPDATNDVVANDDTATTEEGQPVTINILSNDFDPNGDTLGTPTVVTPPTNGTFDPVTGVYTPNPGFVGVDTFVYQVCDDATPQACDTAVVTITVNPTNPVNTTDANDDAYNGDGPTLSGNVLDNDNDIEGNTQTVTSNTQPQNGTVVMNPDGTFVYTPTGEYSGPDQFTYTVCDNGTPQACDTATVYLTINPANTTNAENDINNTFMNIPVSGSVLTNDSDPQGHTQTVTASITTTPEGTLVLNANGTYTFTPATGFTGTFVHTYTVCDNGTPQACDTATLTIEVLPIVSTTNDVVANNDTATTSVDQPVTINILSNDFDPNGDTIGTPTIVTPPSNGTFDPLTGVYIPNPGFVGVDTFVYQICDDGTPQACDTAVVTITIVPTNITNETYANDDAYNGNGPTITGNILNNDTDPEGNTQFVTSNTQPQHGTVVVNLDGTFVYTPTPGYYGPDSFVYTICDNGTPQACDTATVYLTVNAAPAIVITKDSSLSGNVITYTYLVTNTGNVPLTGVSVLETAANFSGTGTLPNPVYVSSNPSAGSNTTTLAVGATSTYTATYTLTQADIDAGQVDNLATASGIDPTGVTVTDDSSDPTPCSSCTPVDPTCTDCTIVEIEQQPSIAIVKEATFNDNNGDGFPQAGETITYTFTVTNTGNMSLFDVIVTDPLPGIVLTGGPIDLAVGQSDSTTFTATYTITQADIVFGSVVNQATASAETIDGEVVDDLSDDDSELEDDPTIVILEGCKLTIFNAVSPNGDGSNDIFYIQGIECYPNNTVEVYNRWGIKVYEVNNYDNISNVFKGYSDGRVTISRNELLPTGTYFYIIKYVDLNGNGIDKSGYLYIQSN